MGEKPEYWDIDHPEPTGVYKLTRAELRELAESFRCALAEYEGTHGRIMDPNDPHWSVTARLMMIKAGFL